MQQLDVRTGRDHKTGKQRILEALVEQLENKLAPLDAISKIAANFEISTDQIKEFIFEGAHYVSSEVIQYLRHSAAISAYEEGKSAEEIARICNCPVGEVDRVILNDRITKLKVIEYDLRAPETDLNYEKSAEYLRLATSFKPADGDNFFGEMPERKALPKEAPPNMPSHLLALYKCEPLSGAQERHLFGKYSFLKCQARRLLSKLDTISPDPAAVEQIEELYRIAYATRNLIASHSLRLVATAARDVNRSESLQKRVSDGYDALLRAIDTFDYLKGNRFTTYVTSAVKKSLLRKYTERMEVSANERQSEFRSHESSIAHPLTRLFKAEYLEGCKLLMSKLSPEKRQIIELSFGLGGDTPMSQKEIAEVVGASGSMVSKLYKQALGELLSMAIQYQVPLPFEVEAGLNAKRGRRDEVRKSMEKLELDPLESNIIKQLISGKERSAGELKVLVAHDAKLDVTFKGITESLNKLIRMQIVLARLSKIPLFGLNWEFSFPQQAIREINY